MMSSSSSRVRTVPTGFQGVLSKITSVPATHAVLEILRLPNVNRPSRSVAWTGVGLLPQSAIGAS